MTKKKIHITSIAVQSNVCSMTILGNTSLWTLLTGGCYSKVVIDSDLTVPWNLHPYISHPPVNKVWLCIQINNKTIKCLAPHLAPPRAILIQRAIRLGILFYLPPPPFPSIKVKAYFSEKQNCQKTKLNYVTFQNCDSLKVFLAHKLFVRPTPWLEFDMSDLNH